MRHKKRILNSYDVYEGRNGQWIRKITLKDVFYFGFFLLVAPVYILWVYIDARRRR